MIVSPHELSPGHAAWVCAEIPGECVGIVERRAALVFAAEQVIADPAWMTAERWQLLVSRLVSLTVVHVVRERFQALVTAVGQGNELMIFDAVDALIYPLAIR